MSARLVALVCLGAWTAPLAGQDSTLAPSGGGGGAAGIPSESGLGQQVIHWGKWVTLGTAIGLTVAAVVQHNHAQDAWNQLLTLCNSNSQACTLKPDGTYERYAAESLYSLTVYYDHLARRRIIVGQVSLLASVGMFVMEFKRKQMSPPNIPLHGLDVLIEPTADGRARLGFTLPF
jgi:hypothetical protein